MTDAFRRRARSRFLLVLSVGSASMWLLACGSKPDTPEGRVRALFEKAEVAAEARDLGTLRELISANYMDDRGHDKQAIVGILYYHFLRNQSVHLLTRVHGIAFPERAKAEATVFVATAGQPIHGTGELLRLRADLFRFDLTLADEGRGAWKVTRGTWRRVEMSDFL